MTHHSRKARKRRTLKHTERELLVLALEESAERSEFKEQRMELRALAFQLRAAHIIIEVAESVADRQRWSSEARERIERGEAAPLLGSDSKSDPRD